jgi:hypothetical protein
MRAVHVLFRSHDWEKGMHGAFGTRFAFLQKMYELSVCVDWKRLTVDNV